jgi:hypothetical protein
MKILTSEVIQRRGYSFQSSFTKISYFPVRRSKQMSSFPRVGKPPAGPKR